MLISRFLCIQRLLAWDRSISTRKFAARQGIDTFHSAENQKIYGGPVRNTDEARSNRHMDSRQRQFEALVNAYAPDLFRYAVWLVRDRTHAEDLVQETFLRAWNSFDSLRDSKAAKSWLITILRRERARFYARNRPETEWTEDLDDLVGSDEIGSDSEIYALRHALASLSEDYREPLLLQVIGGYSCGEIAKMMDLQPGAVMTRLSRARQKLRLSLEGNDKATENRI